MSRHPADTRLDLLVRDSWPSLIRTAYLLTGTAPAAEGLVQDALRRRLGRHRPVTKTELRDAVVREAFRRRALYAAGSAPFAELDGATAPVCAVLRQLPLDERTVLVLRHGQELSVEQVVDVLRVPADAVRKRERRALQVVRTAGLPDALGPLLRGVADALPVPAPPDVQSLSDAASGAQGRRQLVIGLVALVVAVVAVARFLL